MTHFVDIGVNLDHRRFAADRPEVVARARAAGVSELVLTGTSHASSARAAALAAEYDVFSTAGVHPHDSAQYEEHGGTAALSTLLRDPRVVAVGECGLDFDRDFSPRDAQERAFRSQLELAAENGLPLFLHERAAHRTLCEVIDEVAGPPRIVVHCLPPPQNLWVPPGSGSFPSV